MVGRKTHEQQKRMFEKKPDMPDERQMEQASSDPAAGEHAHPLDRDARQSEFPISQRGMNQETRGQNKHNKGGQSGHKPQKHTPAEEKH